MLVPCERISERFTDSGDCRLYSVDSRPDVLAGVLQNGSNAVNKPGDRFHTAAVCQEPSDTINDGCFQVSDRALNSRDRAGGLHRKIAHTKLHNCLVELFGGNLALLHSLTEIARVRAILEHGFLELTGSARDGICKLIPVLGGQLSRTGGLGHHHGNRLEGGGVSTGHSIQVTGSFGQAYIVLNAVRRKLGRCVRHSFQVVNRPGGVVLHSLFAGFDLSRVKPSKGHGGLELGQRISGV